MIPRLFFPSKNTEIGSEKSFTSSLNILWASDATSFIPLRNTKKYICPKVCLDTKIFLLESCWCQQKSEIPIFVSHFPSSVAGDIHLLVAVRYHWQHWIRMIGLENKAVFDYRSSFWSILPATRTDAFSCRRRLDVIYFTRKEVPCSGEIAHKLTVIWQNLENNFADTEVMFRSNSSTMNSSQRS